MTATSRAKSHLRCLLVQTTSTKPARMPAAPAVRAEAEGAVGEEEAAMAQEGAAPLATQRARQVRSLAPERPMLQQAALYYRRSHH
jgi:hypothetical protein